MNSDRTPTLDDLIEARVPGVRRRTLLAAFNRARPDSLAREVNGFTRLDAESISLLRKTFETFPGQLRLPEVRRALGIRKGTSDVFEKALHERLLRIVEDTVKIIPTIQRQRREHPILDLSGLPVTPAYGDERALGDAHYVAAHGEAYGILHLASFDPETGMAMAWEVWKYPGGGHGGEWHEQHLEDFDEGWVRDPSGVTR